MILLFTPGFNLINTTPNFMAFKFNLKNLSTYNTTKKKKRKEKGEYSRMGGAGRTSLLRTLVGSKLWPAAAAAAAATAARLGAERDALLGTTLAAVASAVGAVGIDGIPGHDTLAIPAGRERKIK